MKVIKGLLSFILGILIFALMLGLSLSFVVKNTLQKEILTKAVETKGYDIMEDLLDDISLEPEVKTKIMDTLKKDDTYVKYMRIYVDNYLKYVKDKDYKVSKSDADKISNFVNTTLKEITNTLNLEYNKDAKDYELVDTIFKTSFNYISDSMGEENLKVIKIYSFVTSTSIMLAAITCILVLVLLVSLLQGYRKGIRNLGIISIITGVILGIIYGLFMIFKGDIVKELPFDINLINLIITSVVTFIFGIILTVVSKKLKKSLENE